MHDLIGQTLGQYRIVEQLGKGGMATVYKAFQPSLERYVAIKVLPPYFAHEEGFSQRFEREAKAIARLDHPHILPIYDSGQEGDVSYIVMRYVDAGTLKDVETGEPLPIEQASNVVSQTAEALDYAHQNGVIHRDIKPANILLDRGEWVLLTDFGLARMVEVSQQLTASGVGVGTPAYMAPEQGQGTRVDGRADVYALGVVLYEMLTGRVPYEAETPLAVVLKHVTEPLTMPRLVNPDIPEAAELVILKAMAKNPDDRYQTAGDMAAALCNAVECARAEAVTAVPLAPAVVPAAAPEPVEMPPDEREAELAAPDVPLAVPTIAGALGPDETAEDAPAVAEAREVAETPAKKRRRVSWWAYAVGAVVIVALLGVGALLALDWLSEDAEIGGPTAVAQATATPRPTARPDRESVPAAPPPLPDEEPLVLGTWVRGEADLGALLPPISEALSEAMGRPVELVPSGNAEHLSALVHDGQIDAALMRMPEYLWLRDEQGVDWPPLLYATPIMGAELIVRHDGSVNEVGDLRGRPVAAISWNTYAAIMGHKVLLDEGLDLREEAHVVYLEPDFRAEVAEDVLRLLIEGEVDAAILGSGVLAAMAEEAPELGEKLTVIGESPPMAFGVVAIRHNLPQETVDALHDALLGIDPELLGALAPFSGLASTDEPLVDHFAAAVEAAGLEPWRLVEKVPPDDLRVGEPPPKPGEAPPKPPEEGHLRVALVPEAGTDLARNRIALPIVKAMQRSSADHGFEDAYIEVPPGARPAEHAIRAIEEGFSAIVAVGWYEPAALWELVGAHPDVRFISFGAAAPEPMPNLLSYHYRLEEGGFLAGALAGKATESGKVAAVAAQRVPVIERTLVGFEKGVRHACPDCEVWIEYAESFTDLDLATEIGTRLAREGADVVFNVAGGFGSQALVAAAQEGAWTIGIDWDEYVTTFREGRTPGAERLLGSIVIRSDLHAYEALSELAQGRFKPGLENVGVAEDGVTFLPAPDAAHPDREALEAYLKEVIAAAREGRVKP